MNIKLSEQTAKELKKYLMIMDILEDKISETAEQLLKEGLYPYEGEPVRAEYIEYAGNGEYKPVPCWYLGDVQIGKIQYARIVRDGFTDTVPKECINLKHETD